MLNKLRNHPLLERLKGQGHGAVLVRGSLFYSGITTAGYVLAFLSFTLLARVLGVESYGIFAVACSWVALLNMLAGLGIAQVWLRFVAAYRVRESLAELHGLLRWGRSLVLKAGLALALFSSFVLFLLREQLSDAMLLTFIPVCLILVLGSQAQLNSLGLRGLRRFVISAVPEQILKPVLVIGGIFAVQAWFGSADSVDAMWLTLCAVGLSWLILQLALRRALPAGVFSTAPVRHEKMWLRTSLPMMLIAGMHLIQSETDIVMLGWLADTDQAGIYSAASRVSGAVAFGLGIVNAIAAPLFSELYAGGESDRLQRLVSLSALGISLSVVPAAIVLLLAGEWILSWFGPEFTTGYLALLVLGVAQIINALSGSTGFLLNMTGHQDTVAKVLTLSALLNVIGNAVMIPNFGMMGAAYTTAFTIILWNLIMVYQVRRKLSIRPTVFASWRVLRA